MDFQPEALQLLIDRMKINSKVGATCGRIKPDGSGNNSVDISHLTQLNPFLDCQYYAAADPFLLGDNLNGTKSIDRCLPYRNT